MAALKLDANMLSKKSLVLMVNHIREKMLPEDVFAGMVRADRVDEINRIRRKLEALEKTITTMKAKLTVRSPRKKYAEYNRLVSQYSSLSKRGNRLIDLVKKIDSTFPVPGGKKSNEQSQE